MRQRWCPPRKDNAHAASWFPHCSREPACSIRVNNDVEALIRARWHEIARELIVLGVSDLERVLTPGISFGKPLLADGVGKVEQMELVGYLRLRNHGAHPVAILDA